ncbi:hypothetical protein MPSEU_000378900 [Mayamaea pseudoterrestris]|nr:hypothetical protein MPSEU_000378900 [Mayamaea pseudoterrestris]
MLRWNRTRLYFWKEWRNQTATFWYHYSSRLAATASKRLWQSEPATFSVIILGGGLVAISMFDSLQCRKLCEHLSRHSAYALTPKASTTRCDEQLHEFDEGYPSGHSERERFINGLQYHRSLLFDYVRRWNDVTQSSNAQIHNSITWPRNVPTVDEIPSLELDLRFCSMSPNYRNNAANCQNLQFRIASFYVTRENELERQKHGFKLLQDVASHGHPDAMCLYAIMLNEGRLPGMETNPEEAVIWWRRCVDLHRHITATYELAVAYYTGEGCPENPDYAVRLFRQAAHLGHAGAAYMLGECLLDGVGVSRDRGAALEWLVTAAELGHHLARERVIIVLNEDDESMDAGMLEATTRDDEYTEAKKWAGDVKGTGANIERRFTIGPASEEMGRRKNKVLESRDT